MLDKKEVKMEANKVSQEITVKLVSAMNEITTTLPEDISEFRIRELLGTIPDNDMDAALFAYAQLGDVCTLIPTGKTSGDWYFWNGKVHQRDAKNLLDEYMATTIADVIKEAVSKVYMFIAKCPDIDDDTKKDLKDWTANTARYGKGIRSNAALRNLKERLRIKFQQEPNYFDNDQRWAVLKDGMVLDLTDLDGELLEPDSSRPVSKCLGVAYKHDMEAPHMWIKALNDWVPERAVQDYLQVAAGAALLGRGDAKNIVTLIGMSHTGKSTYVNVLSRVFGDYAGKLPSTAIVQKYGGSSNFEQDKARGKRFLYLSEPQQARTDDAFLKNLAGGGETIPTAQKGKDAVEWYAQCVLHIASNHEPKFDTRDNAIVERMNLIGFDHVFAPNSPERVYNLEEQLIEKEGSAIFSWIVEGARRYLELGYIPVPESVSKRGQDNVIESSAPLRWLLERVEDGVYQLTPGAPMTEMVQPKEAYPDFRQWLIDNGEKEVKQKDWLREIEAYNNMPKSKKGTRPGGYARLYGVLPVHIPAENCKEKMHNTGLRSTMTWREATGR